jgi:hypothetical protein
MRWCVAQIIRDQLLALDMRYPSLPEEERAKVVELRRELESGS